VIWIAISCSRVRARRRGVRARRENLTRTGRWKAGSSGSKSRARGQLAARPDRGRRAGEKKIVDDCGRLQGLLPMNLAIYIVAGGAIVAILIYALSQGRPPILERATNDQGEQGNERGAAMCVNKLIETRVQ
jgi:hypothetical protein